MFALIIHMQGHIYFSEFYDHEFFKTLEEANAWIDARGLRDYYRPVKLTPAICRKYRTTPKVGRHSAKFPELV
jgi:hypothetical protein